MSEEVERSFSSFTLLSAETAAALASSVPAAVSAGMFAVSAKLAVAPAGIVALLQLIVPPAPTAGVLHVKPGASASETKVVAPGSVSLSATFVAAAGPPLMTVMVQVTFEREELVRPTATETTYRVRYKDGKTNHIQRGHYHETELEAWESYLEPA